MRVRSPGGVSRSPRSRLPALIGLALVGGGLLVGLSVLALSEGGQKRIRVEGVQDTQRLYGGLQQEGDTLGDPEAPVSVSVFNDLQCTDCADYHLRTTPRLVDDLVREGKARLEFRHFPTGLRPRLAAAYAAIAAGNQGRQWQYVDLLYRNQDEAKQRGVTDDFLEQIAESVPNLDVDLWRRERDDPEVERRVDADAKLAASLKLPAQPAVVVDGPGGTRKLVSSPSIRRIEETVDDVK